MTVYSFYIYGDARDASGLTVTITKAERVVLEGRRFIKQYGDSLYSERDGTWFDTEQAAREAAAGELLLIGHRIIAQAKQVCPA